MTNQFVVVYRMGGTDRFTWRRTVPAAVGVALVLKKEIECMGYLALKPVPAAASEECGLPDTFGADDNPDHFSTVGAGDNFRECVRATRVGIYWPSELRRVFDRVADRKDWKAPIDARILEQDYEITDAAIAHFTGVGIATVMKGPGKMIRVTAIGYRAGQRAITRRGNHAIFLLGEIRKRVDGSGVEGRQNVDAAGENFQV